MESKVKNLVFDFGRVLVDYSFEDFLEPLLGSREKASWFMKHVYTDEVDRRYAKELRPTRHYTNELKREWPEFEHTLEALETSYPEIVTGEVPGMRELLKSLKDKGYRLYGLSNWSSHVYDTLEHYKIFDLLDDRMISCEVHQVKPDVEIYHTFLKKFDLNPEECVFTDDKLENVEGAKAAGMHAIQFKNAKQYQQELERLVG